MSIAIMKNNQSVTLRESTIEDAQSIIKFYNTVGDETTNL